jgi:hypothetical protein
MNANSDFLKLTALHTESHKIFCYEYELFDRHQIAGFTLFADDVLFKTFCLAPIFIIVRATAVRTFGILHLHHLPPFFTRL